MSEDADSGLLGQVRSILGVTTHPEPPTLRHTTAVAAPGKLDAFLLTLDTLGSGFVYVLAIPLPSAHGSHMDTLKSNDTYTYDGIQWDATRVKSVATVKISLSSDTVQDILVPGLRAGATYDILLCTESITSGILSRNIRRIGHVTTHRAAPTLRLQSDELDCSQAPDCLELHRDACWLEPHTCGECLDGYTGTRGADNTPCVHVGPQTEYKNDLDELDELTAQPVGYMPQHQAAFGTTQAAPFGSANAEEAESAVERTRKRLQMRARRRAAKDKDELEATRIAALEYDRGQLFATSTAQCPENAQLLKGTCACGVGYVPNRERTGCVRRACPLNSHADGMQPLETVRV